MGIKYEIEIMIPVFWDQLDVVIWSIPYIKEHLSPKRIVFIGPSAIADRLPKEDKMIFIDEDSLVDGMNKKHINAIISEIIKEKDIAKLADRGGWYLQQFIKMAYCLITEEKEYLVWDADMVPLRKILFWDSESNKKIFISGGKHHHMAYYDTMNRLLDKEIVPSIEDTYVAHNMFFETNIMRELINKITDNLKLKGDIWWKKILYTVNPDELQESGFSEYETYGEFVKLYYPDKYVMKAGFKKITNSRTFFDNRPNDRQIKWVARDFEGIGFEIRAHKEEFWYSLCNLLCDKVPFKFIYRAEDLSHKLTWRGIKNKLKRLKK